jgi:prevent-host-death family protein
VKVILADQSEGERAEIGSNEAKTRLPKLLVRVARGERITITKHGVPVAMLVPVEEKPRPDVGKVIEQIKASRRGHKLGSLTIRQLIEEGRRF